MEPPLKKSKFPLKEIPITLHSDPSPKSILLVLFSFQTHVAIIKLPNNVNATSFLTNSFLVNAGVLKMKGQTPFATTMAHGAATRFLLPLFLLISLGGYLLPHFFIMESMTLPLSPKSDEKSSALQLNRNSFPEGFIFGTASSAYQASFPR